MPCKLTSAIGAAAIIAMTAVAAVAAPSPAAAQSGPPIKIGYSMALTGGLAPNGRSGLLAQKIWEEDINAKGGLLGRPVRLVYYDDQSNPSTVPGIYTKLLDIDKVDLIIGGYATAQIAPAMPVAMQRNKVFVSLMGLAVNSEFNYPNYFSMVPSGPEPKPSITKGFFDTAMAQNPKPRTVAIVAADQEFSRNASDGARDNAAKAGLRIVYDRSYPPTTADFTPIMRAIAAANPDLVVICSYPPDSVGMVKAVNEIGFRPKMIGGGMVGLQATALKMQLGPLLNGFVNYDYWLPVPTMMSPGIADLVKKYQARAQSEGVDALGYYMAPWAYAQLDVLGQAIEATKSLDDRKLADYMRANTFKTVLGDIAFGKDGELARGRMLQIQFHDVKGNDIEQFRTMGTQTVLTPAEYSSGNVIYPYEKAK
jgi:branched-chain amino acid transport system substrate-binding protein